MINIKVGYIRVSSLDQNTARQEAMMNENVERLFVDKASGKNMERAQLKEMLGYLREGDVLIVESISRLARNTRDLLTIIDELNKKEVQFISLKENIDTNTPSGKFMITVFGAISGYNSAFITSPLSMVIVTTGFAIVSSLLFKKYCISLFALL